MIEIKESFPSSCDCLLWPFHQLELLVLFLLSAKSFLRDRILSTTALCVSSLEGRNKSSALTGACKSDENPSMKMSPSLAQADKSWYFCFLVAVLWPFTRPLRNGSIRSTSNTESVTIFFYAAFVFIMARLVFVQLERMFWSWVQESRLLQGKSSKLVNVSDYSTLRDDSTDSNR